MASAALTAPRRVRQAQLARELGVSRQAINKLVQRKVISADQDGLIDVELARHAIASRVSPDSKSSQAISVLPAVATIPTASAAATPAAAADSAALDEGTIVNYHVAKTLNETAQARMNQLKLKEMQGELIRLADVRTAVAGSMAMAREALMQVPTRLSAILAGVSDASEIHRLLDEEIVSALQELGRGLGNAALEDIDDE